MAYSNGRIYVNDLVTPPIGVSIYDVQQALGVGDNDLGTLCMENNVNWKSAYKPIYFAKVGQLTDTDLATGRATAVSGYTISYGIKARKSSAVADYIDTSALSEYFPVKDAPWQYDMPVEDGTNVFRLTDFNEYWHTAEWAMGLTFPTSSYMYVPAQGTTGQDIAFHMNWDWSKYNTGGMAPQKIFAAIQGYYPSILLTCFYQGGTWNYAKSAKKPGGGYFTIGEIGASSAQSGCSVSINTGDLYHTIGSNGLIEGRKFTACWVLLSAYADGVSTDSMAFFDTAPADNKQVVRLQLPSPSTVVDRKELTIVPKKKTYISSISATVTVVKQTNTPSGSFHRWNVASIVFTFEKETADTITFVLKGKFSCQVGTAYAQGQPDGDGNYTISSSVSVTGTGTQTYTLSLQSNTIYYDPTAPETGSNVIRVSGTLYLQNSTYGNWQSNYGIETAPSEPYWSLDQNINLS